MALLDIVRWMAILAGAVILGLHMAVFNNANRIVEHPNPWRIFIAGNSVLTLYAMGALWLELGRGTIYIVTIAMFTTLIGLFSLDRSYRQKKTNNNHNKESYGV